MLTVLLLLTLLLTGFSTELMEEELPPLPLLVCLLIKYLSDLTVVFALFCISLAHLADWIEAPDTTEVEEEEKDEEKTEVKEGDGYLADDELSSPLPEARTKKLPATSVDRLLQEISIYESTASTPEETDEWKQIKQGLMLLKETVEQRLEEEEEWADAVSGSE